MEMRCLVVDAAMSTSRRRSPSATAGAGSQTRFEVGDRASQITARLIRNGQAHHAMRMDFPERFGTVLLNYNTSTGSADLLTRHTEYCACVAKVSNGFTTSPRHRSSTFLAPRSVQEPH